MEKFIKIVNSPTARSTSIYYFANFFLNVSRYFFHLILLRFLSPGEYGEFLSYLSLTYLLGIPMGTVASVVTKSVSELRGKGDRSSINQFFYFILKVTSPLAYILGFLVILFAGPLAHLFKANSVAFVVLGVSMFISLYQTVISSYLLAFQRFIFQTVVGFVGIILTILFSILFIELGLGATGAVVGQLLAGAITTLLIFYNIRSYILPRLRTASKVKFSLAGFTGYSFIYALGTLSLISTDILVVRALFDTNTSGLYSALSILGRMILFGLTPLIGLVLPLATHRYAVTGSAQSIFYKLGSVMTLFGLIGAGLFSLFPSLAISILSGPEYLSASSFLSIFSFSMVWFALSQFILSYLMATGRPKANILLLIATFTQPLLIYIFRHSISSVIWSEFFLFLALFVTLLVYALSLRQSSPSRTE